MLESLGHYRLLDRIGKGGIGDVYRARDTRLGRTVAIKVVKPEVVADADRRDRLVRDAQAARALSHPNIAALYEIGEDPEDPEHSEHRGQLFLVFEFVPGEPLKAVLGGHPLNPRRAIELSAQIADALADAHAREIVHRDLKPDNVSVTPKGAAKILDFGFANWTDGGLKREQAARTTDAAAINTVAYMSPEQALGEPVDGRTDIFSLGIVLFEMLTGKLPFSGTTPSAVALQIVQAVPPAPSSIVKSLPQKLDAVSAKALARSLDRRYSSAAMLAADLRSVGDALQRARDSAPRR